MMENPPRYSLQPREQYKCITFLILTFSLENWPQITFISCINTEWNFYFIVESYHGSRLSLWRVDRRQMGAYLCIASNDIPPAVSKRIILNVNCEYVIILFQIVLCVRVCTRNLLKLNKIFSLK